MDMDDKIVYITSLIDASLLPELKRDLGSDYIQSTHFDSFRQTLDHHLLQIFDLVQHNDNILENIEGYTRNLRSKFLLLICEQLAPNTLYQTSDANLIKNLNKLSAKYFNKLLNADSQLTCMILNFYKERLRVDCWKKHLGSIHGFDTFCQMYYTENKLDRDMCNFILSVSLILEEYYEPAYKEMSFRLIKILLYRTPETILLESNLHEALFDTLFRNIPKTTSAPGITNLWDCLYKCIALMKIKDYLKWNKMDELFEALISRITFESITDYCIHLFLIFPKLCLINSPNGEKISNQITLMLSNNEINFDALRKDVKNEQLQVFYRWVNRLLKLFIAESHRLLVKENNALTLLKVIHICYIICITSIPTKVCEIHLLEFFEKFSMVLVEIVAMKKSDLNIIINVKEFFETISKQLTSSIYQPVARDKLSDFVVSVEKLLQNEIFQTVCVVES